MLYKSQQTAGNAYHMDSRNFYGRHCMKIFKCIHVHVRFCIAVYENVCVPRCLINRKRLSHKRIAHFSITFLNLSLSLALCLPVGLRFTVTGDRPAATGDCKTIYNLYKENSSQRRNADTLISGRIRYISFRKRFWCNVCCVLCGIIAAQSRHIVW